MGQFWSEQNCFILLDLMGVFVLAGMLYFCIIVVIKLLKHLLCLRDQ